MNITCIDAPADVEELALAGLKTAPSKRLRTPRVEASPVALECVLHADVPLSTNQFIAIGRIVRAHVGGEFVLDAAQHLFDTPALKLIGAMLRPSGTLALRIGRHGAPHMGGLGQTAELRNFRMAKGYWVAFADVSDPEGYKAYIAENAKAFRKYGGRFLTRGGPSEAPEGNPRARAVVIEFPTYEAALECYRSAEYAKAMALRQGKSVMDLAIVQGYDGPQPTDS